MKNMDLALKGAIDDHKRGRVDAALAVYREILDADPNHPEARHMMGVVYLQQGRPAEAEAEVLHAIRVNGNEAKYFNTLGNVLTALGRVEEALGAFERTVELDPRFPGAGYNKGTALLLLGRASLAEACFRGLVEAGELNPRVFNNLGTALIQQNKVEEALDLCRQGLAQSPRNVELLTTYASALELANDLAGAEEAARGAREVAPQYPLARIVMARVLRRQKRTQEALAELAPLFAEGAQLAPADKVEALYEEGLTRDAAGQAGEAFKAISRCNELQSEGPSARRCDADRYLDRVADMRAWFTGERIGILAERAAVSDDRPAPVFFVGFPRSGTTLMEQVLKAHPRLATTEEKTPLDAVRRQVITTSGSYPDGLESMGPGEMESLRDLFWQEAEDAVGTGLDEKILVDKLPLNVAELGLVNALFPNAKVLVALRDPRDACLSAFIQKFGLNDAMANFLDLERTGRTYAAVMDLWLHYRGIMTLPYLEYRYEDLVENFEGTVRKVLDFIGVGWSAEVEGYREAAASRTIATPSYRDATAPLYKRAMGRWQAYDQDLVPILPVLKPFIEAFGYDTWH